MIDTSSRTFRNALTANCSHIERRRSMALVAAEIALHVLAYNLTRAMDIMGVRSLAAAIMG
jgi:hypothetical protein